MVLVDFLHEYTVDKLTSRWPWVTTGQKMTNNSKKQPYCSSLTPTAFGFVVFTLSRRDYATMITFSSWRLCGEKRTELPLHTNLNAQIIEKTWKKGHLKTNPRWKKYAWICLAIHCFDGLPWLFGKFDYGASRTIHGSSPQFSARKPLICTKKQPGPGHPFQAFLDHGGSELNLQVRLLQLFVCFCCLVVWHVPFRYECRWINA